MGLGCWHFSNWWDWGVGTLVVGGPGVLVDTIVGGRPGVLAL